MEVLKDLGLRGDAKSENSVTDKETLDGDRPKRLL